jgi:hypothetical protein
MASANQIYFTIENVKKDSDEESPELSGGAGP